MTTIDMMQTRNELCYFLRSSDVLSTSIRGLTRTTESYTVTGSETTHTFSHVPIHNFKSLTVNSVAKYYLRDYTFIDTIGVLTWNTPLNNNDSVSAQYDYGSGDHVYPDMPRDFITLDSYPRVGIEITSTSTEPLGIGGTTHISDILVTILVWAPANKKVSTNNFGGVEDVEATMNLVRDAIRSNAKNFYTFTWITPHGRGPLTPGKNNIALQMSQDFSIRFKTE